MRALVALAVTLIASCAGGGPPVVLPPAETPPSLTSARTTRDDRMVMLAAGCMLGRSWSEAAGDRRAHDRCTELRLSTVGDPGTQALVLAIGRGRDVEGTIDLMGHVDARARVIGILSAVQKTENGVELSRGRKAELLALFALAPPDKLRAIDLLARLELAAEAEGHPVVAEGKTFEQRERSAWAGAREGLAERLRAATGALPDSELKRVALRTASRLDVEFRTRDLEVSLEPAPSDGHDLVIAAASCWLGRTWGDGAPRRCETLAHAVYAEPDRAYENYDALRAAEPAPLDDLAVKAGPFGAIARAIGAAAADSRKIPALIDMRGEPGAIGWLFALDRLEAARERPLREEAGLAAMIFRMRPQGSWLDTFEHVAKVAGHPLLPIDLVEDADEPSDAELQRLARASVAVGIADRLRPHANDARLGPTIRETVNRLDAEYRAARWDYAH